MKIFIISLLIFLSSSSFQKNNKDSTIHYQNGWLVYWGDNLLGTDDIIFIPSYDKKFIDGNFFCVDHNKLDSIGFRVNEYYFANEVRPIAKKYQVITSEFKKDNEGDKGYDTLTIALLPVKIKYKIDVGSSNNMNPIVIGKSFKKTNRTINIAYLQYTSYDNLEISLLRQKDIIKLKKLRKNKTSPSLPPIH